MQPRQRCRLEQQHCYRASAETLVQVDIALQALLLERAQFMGLLLHLAVEAHHFLLQLLDLVEQVAQVLSLRPGDRWRAAGDSGCAAGALFRP